MLTGNLVRVRNARNRVVPLYLDPDDPELLETAEILIRIFREGVNRTRAEIEEQIEELLGEGVGTIAQRGLAKVLEDRAEFEVVSDVEPETLRREVFRLAAEHRRELRSAGYRAPFRRDRVLAEAAAKFGVDPEKVVPGLFADLKDENRMLAFEDISPERLLHRYNVALAQAVLLRSVLVVLRVPNESPARYRQLLRRLKFHRLLHRVEGSPAEGYVFKIDGPLSLFSATNKYGLQMAMFLPAVLLCRNFSLEAELRWGPRREPRVFRLDHNDGLVSHYADPGVHIPPEVRGFEERFRQIAPEWEMAEAAEIVELGRDGVWIPDYVFTHRMTGIKVRVEVAGFWKRSAVERLVNLLRARLRSPWLLLVGDRMKVDETEIADLGDAVLRFREVPIASDLRDRLRAIAADQP